MRIGNWRRGSESFVGFMLPGYVQSDLIGHSVRVNVLADGFPLGEGFIP